MGKIKVLIVAGDMGLGGIENQLVYLVRNADRDKFQFDFTTTVSEPYYKDEVESLGGRFIHIDYSKGGKSILRYCRDLFRIIKEGNYDVVHSHELFHSGVVLALARLAGVKRRFAHAHNWTDMNSLTEKRPLKRSIYNAVMRKLIQHNATVFCACSSYAGRFLYGEKVTHLPNYHLIFNSVDTKKYLNNTIGDGLLFPEDGWTNVLNIGRMCEQKDQLFTVEIAKEIKKQDKNIRISCAGDNANDYGEIVKKRIQENQLGDYIALLGIRDDIDRLLMASSVFILPSQFEGMPLVLIEAQASGIQSVCADTFSREVDFGLDTIEWIDKTESPKKWVDAIVTASKKERANKNDIVVAIEKNGFDCSHFAKKLYALYEGEE